MQMVLTLHSYTNPHYTARRAFTLSVRRFVLLDLVENSSVSVDLVALL